MIELDFEGIGNRIAMYRKMNGLSAEKLATEAGADLTRSIIANIENGRRQDIGINQLLAIAWAMKVSPTALLFPIDQPFSSVETSDGPRPVAEILQWMTGWIDRGLPHMGVTPATQHSGIRMLGLRTGDRLAQDIVRKNRQIEEARKHGTDGDVEYLLADRESLEESLHANVRALEGMGVEWPGRHG